MTLTYPEVGAVPHDPLPAGYRHLRVRRRLGLGDLERVGEALVRFDVHRAAGVRVEADADRAAPGVRVVSRLGAGPVGLRVPCRVVRVLEEPDRRGFTYGTLRGNPFVGEEMFAVERDPDGVLWFVVRAFSRPAWPVLRPLGAVIGLAQHAYVRRLAGAAGRLARRAG